MPSYLPRFAKTLASEIADASKPDCVMYILDANLSIDHLKESQAIEKMKNTRQIGVLINKMLAPATTL